MGIIGCGIMVAGLVAGALFAGIWLSLGVMAAGLLLVAAASWRQHKKEQAAEAQRAAEARRATYPPYDY